MKTKILAFLLVICFLLAATALYSTSPKVAAVDIFSRCSQDTANNRDSCADCKTAAAQTDVCQDATSQATQVNPIITGLKVAINILSFATGAASVIIIIVSSLRMVFSGGESGSVSRARNGILYAVIGIAVTVISQAVILLVLDKLK